MKKPAISWPEQMRRFIKQNMRAETALHSTGSARPDPLDRSFLRPALVIVFSGFLQFPMTSWADKQPPMRPDSGVIKTLAETNGFTLGRPTHLRWVPDGSALLFLRSGP